MQLVIVLPGVAVARGCDDQSTVHTQMIPRKIPVCACMCAM